MFSYYNVHTPIQPDRSTIDKYRMTVEEKFADPTPTIDERDSISRGRQDNPEYASMVNAVDTSVGRVLASLDQAGIADDTVIFFFSDNGGLCTVPFSRGKKNAKTGGPTSNLPLRSGKGWLYEGGVREPLIISAPGQMKVGVCETPVISTDFFPTILDLAGLSLEPALHTDRTSIKPLLVGDSIAARDLHWHYPHYHGSGWTPGASIRSGDWKLIEFYETDQTELYNLADDPVERNDMAETDVETRDRLKRSLKDWQTKSNAKMPVGRKSR
jgi:arylsulfatase A-like enzyme